MDIDNQEKQKFSFNEFIKKNKFRILSLFILLVLFFVALIGYSEYTKKKNLIISQDFN